ncbi:MAG: molybdate ABC transporter permease subunit [Anaerolineaceae bacterium]|nr:molybdate ABC transporter permease subunit [Anaerolineaceae bacterium]
MDWFPLWNSLRIAAISTVIIFFLSIYAAWKIARMPKFLKGFLDVILTLPLVLPPTVVGFFLLKLLGPYSAIGSLVLRYFESRLVMEWYSAIFSSVIVAFPLMYRTARGAFESFDPDLKAAGQTLGMSNARVFWQIVMPTCRQGVIAGCVLAFARALGEYGATSMIAGYTPGQTATISTTVYQLWRTGDDYHAAVWVLINLAISAMVLLVINSLESQNLRRKTVKV